MKRSTEEFIAKTKELCSKADRAMEKAQTAIDSVSKFVQTKYPEVTSEYLFSDGGITFIGLGNTEVEGYEYYGIENLISRLGER